MGGGARTFAPCKHLSATLDVDFELRPATVEDISEVASIELASFGDPWSEGAFQQFLRTEKAIFLVGIKGRSKALAGYLVALAVGEQAEVLNLAVAPAERGQGLGGELLDAGLAAVGARGAREAFLEVRESNAAALALYRSREFSVLTRRRKYYRNPVEDALVLRRGIEG